MKKSKKNIKEDRERKKVKTAKKESRRRVSLNPPTNRLPTTDHLPTDHGPTDHRPNARPPTNRPSTNNKFEGQKFYNKFKMDN